MVMENVNFYKMTQTLSDLMLSDFVKTKFVFSKLLNETLNHQQKLQNCVVALPANLILLIAIKHKLT